LVVQEIQRKRDLKEKLKKQRQVYYENKVVRGDIGCGMGNSSTVRQAPTAIKPFQFRTDDRKRTL
jgi:hypothetical protein